MVTNFTSSTIDEPGSITAGPDGAMWFTNSRNNTIGRITTSGLITSYADPSVSNPQGLAKGPDGALWFANEGNLSTNQGDIGRITTAGVISDYSMKTHDVHGLASPFSITAGPDDAMWVTAFNDSIDRIGVATTVTVRGTDLAHASEVAFNGTPADIVSDTSSKIVTNVPDGATSGPISVTTPRGTATSSTSFMVR